MGFYAPPATSFTTGILSLPEIRFFLESLLLQPANE